jgi:RNA polymerase sigma-70 factor (ECF subfamily)
MGIQKDHLKIVEQAMVGRKEDLSRLAEIVREPLRSYVYRIAFNEDIIDDIVQETLVEMYKIFSQLKRAENFWPWLCKIALNKLRIHSRTNARHRELLKANSDKFAPRPAQPDGLANAINEELKNNILLAMSVLSERQKAVMSMRCYEDLSYTQIADIMGMSELGCRLLFVRARKKLQSKLYSLGYGQKSLIFALVLFGKLTAPSEAAAANVCVTPAVLSAGGIAGGIAFLTGKAMITTAAGVAVVAGVATMKSGPSGSNVSEPSPAIGSSMFGPNHFAENPIHFNEGYYLFPQGKQGPVMTRLAVHEKDRVIQVLQNDAGNYFYDARRNTVAVNNYHYWKLDLSVMTLPTDDPALESFLARIEGRTSEPRSINSDSPNLYIVASGDESRYTPSFGIKNYDALMEERFRYNWPAGMTLRDNRDALRLQGWCYFTIRGQLHGCTISGSGRLPFVYPKSLDKTAWLKLSLADKWILIDTPTAAAVLNVSDLPVAQYLPGTFLIGLNRPWAGLHTIDNVRRDAARYRIPFETEIDPSGTIAVVRLRLSEGKIEYTVNMQNDWIERIQFFTAADAEVGHIDFDYLNPHDADPAEFVIPRLSLSSAVQKKQPFHWLSELGAGNLLLGTEMR